MTNVRQKGKRKELQAVKLLQKVFPDVSRNWLAQTAKKSNGSDLANTSPFNFEVKGGKQAKIKKIRKWLDQVAAEGRKEDWDVVLALPDRENPYIVMPLDDFLELLISLKKEGII